MIMQIVVSGQWEGKVPDLFKHVATNDKEYEWSESPQITIRRSSMYCDQLEFSLQHIDTKILIRADELFAAVQAFIPTCKR